MESDAETEEWRRRFIDYYEKTAPENVSKVNDKMMAKFAGQYEDLMDKLVAKCAHQLLSPAIF